MFFITIKIKTMIPVFLLTITLVGSFALLIGFSPLANTVLMSPEQVIQEHFKGQNEKSIEKTEEMLIEKKKGIVWWGLDNIEYIRVICISEEKRDAWIKRYKEWAVRDGINPENACLYIVRFEVKFKNELFSNYPSGIQIWHYYLIRKNKISPWLIAGWAGY